MGLFSIFGGKSPEEIELIADDYFKAEEFGAAKMEYEKALKKARKSVPEKPNLINGLESKISKSQEALALSHQQTAENLMISENYEEAEGLFQLALDLTENEEMKKKIEESLKSMRKKQRTRLVKFHDETQTPVSPEEDGEHIENIDEYFTVLCAALPEAQQDKYHEYGKAFKLGYIALNNGDFETAAEQLEKANAENSYPHSLIPVEWATALIHLQQLEKAETVLDQFIQDNPEELRGYQFLCEVYWDRKEFDRAIELLQACPDEIKNSLSIQVLLGETQYLKGSYSEALKIFRDSLAVFGFNEIIARALAKTHESLGDIKKARDLYAKIINGCQSCGTRADPFVKSRYAELSFQSGDKPADLLDIYFSLVQEDPDNKYQYYQRIQEIYENMGNTEQALRYQAMAESVAP